MVFAREGIGIEVGIVVRVRVEKVLEVRIGSRGFAKGRNGIFNEVEVGVKVRLQAVLEVRIWMIGSV